MFKLSHDGSLGEKVRPGLVAGPGLERLDGHQHVLAAVLVQATSTHIPELSAANDGLDCNIAGIL